jgi:predicted ATPase
MSALLERDAEVARMSDLVDLARSGTGRCLVIQGPPGIGKTELVRLARATARQAGLLVLSAQGGELEREMHFGLVRQLLEPAIVGASDDVLRSLFAGSAGVARAALVLTRINYTGVI